MARRKLVRRQRRPSAIERGMLRELRAIVNIVKVIAGPTLELLPELVERARIERQDAGEGDQIAVLMAALRERVAGIVDEQRLKKLMRLLGHRVADFNEDQLLAQVTAARGVAVFIPSGKTALWIDGFVAENVALIKSIPEQLISRIETSATRAVASATTSRTFAKELRESFKMSTNRAKVIARDQVGKLYGQINASRQKSLGITHFTWRTVGDERVRDDHEDRNGVVYAYASPPAGELPGTPVQCRCSAEPVFDGVGVSESDPSTIPHVPTREKRSGRDPLTELGRGRPRFGRDI